MPTVAPSMEDFTMFLMNPGSRGQASAQPSAMSGSKMPSISGAMGQPTESPFPTGGGSIEPSVSESPSIEASELPSISLSPSISGIPSQGGTMQEQPSASYFLSEEPSLVRVPVHFHQRVWSLL